MMGECRVLGARDLAAVVAAVGRDEFLDELVARLADAFQRHDDEVLITPDRDGFHYLKPDLGLVEWMPAMDTGRAVAIKIVGYHPSNPVQRAIPSVLATVSLFDTVTGEQLMLCEASLLTALRTGAASAVATEILATTGPVTLGVVGAGTQAVTQVHAVSRVRDVTRILAHDTSEETLASLAARLDFIDVPVEFALPEQILAESDVLCTCTSVPPGEGPVLPAGEHRPWLHVNAVGADFAGKLELPAPLLAEAFVCPDVRSQCILEGECQQIPADKIGPDLAHLVQERDRHGAQAGRLTVFDSTGWSLEDLVAVELARHHAERLDIGAMVDLRPDTADPFDPYALLRRRS